MGEFDSSTGEVKNGWLKAKYRGLTFKVYESGYAELQGSLHKFYNEGLHNHNDFTFSQVSSVLEQLHSQFKINLHEGRISTLEYGVNVNPPLSTNKILNNLKMHKNRPFDTSYNQHYKQSRRQQYYVKAYNKGKQNNLPEENFRFEMKSIRSIFHNRLGISVLADLLKQSNYKQLALSLFNAWDNCIYYDNTIDTSAINKPVRS